MPELPEVETMRRGVLGIVGTTIVSAERTPCAKKPIAITPRIDYLNRRVAGQKIVGVDRLGKRVVVRLNSGERLVLEPRMTGLVLISDPPTSEHLRFCLTLKHSMQKQKRIEHLLFWDRRGLGRVALLSDAEYRSKLSDGTLGPDALDVTVEEFADRFRHSAREVKVALLDQSMIAGIGNLYASEILHRAGVHPRVRCNRLSKKRWWLIYEAMREVLETAIEYEGSTLSDGTYRNALNQSGGYQNEHRVYDRAGKSCPRCRDQEIKRIVQAQRSTFFCRGCQKR
jgi:formamidopyrimidine-DNA glycosylase